VRGEHAGCIKQAELIIAALLAQRIRAQGIPIASICSLRREAKQVVRRGRTQQRFARWVMQYVRRRMPNADQNAERRALVIAMSRLRQQMRRAPWRRGLDSDFQPHRRRPRRHPGVADPYKLTFD